MIFMSINDTKSTFSFHELANAFTDTIFVIEDEKGNIVEPTDESVFFYLNSLVKMEEGIYYLPLIERWYSLTEETNSGYKIKRYLDITKFVHKEKLYTYDEVTGVAIRRKFLEDFKAYLKIAIEKNDPFAVFFADIDKFKLVNDQNGHEAGDAVLRSIAQNLYGNTRQNTLASENYKGDRRKSPKRLPDPFGRYGGEEFAGALPCILPEDSIKKFNLMREKIASKPIYYRHKLVDDKEVYIPVTMSFGVVNVFPSYLKQFDLSTMTLDELALHLLHLADENLYNSKETGRNKVTLTLLK